MPVTCSTSRVGSMPTAPRHRRVPIASFFTGVRRTVLAPEELLVELFVPAPGPRSGGSYIRHTPRR